MDKPIAWYDPSNGMVSTDQDCPLFTPLGQVWGLYLKEEAKDEPVAWRAWVSKFPQGTGSDWVYVTKPIMKDSVHNQPLYTTPPQQEKNEFNPDWDTQAVLVEEIQRMAKRIEELEAKDEPYALEASMFSNDRVKIDPATGNVSIGTPQQEANDEPVAWAMLHDNGHFIDAIHPNEHARVEGEYITPLYTTPPQRTWVGLTDEEIEDFVSALWPVGAGAGKLLRAVEAKLKEKNT
jgi:hypothetical protein